MRTLQEKYNGINEGKFTKEQFLRDARMEQPNLVTQYNGYSDAVQILKNRGMIQENTDFSDYSNDALTDMIINSSRFEGNQEAIERIKAELARRKEEENVQEEVDVDSEFDVLRGGKVIARNVKFFPNGKDYRVGNGVSTLGPHDSTQPSTMGGATDMINHIKSQGGLREARLTKSNLTDYRYKPTNDMDKYPYEQILRGLRVELEGLNVLGTPTPEEYTKALGKVLKNLQKDSIFYTNQVAGVKANKKRTDVMVDATPKNEVDKENGLQKAALKEAIKGVIKNLLSEEATIEAPLHGEEEFEMQGPKSDQQFKSELDDYLQDNQIYGYTNKIHAIMTQEDPVQAAGDLALFLDDNQIYGYNRGIEAIYDEYPYEEMYEGYEEEGVNLSPEGPQMFESVSLKDILD